MENGKMWGKWSEREWRISPAREKCMYRGESKKSKAQGRVTGRGRRKVENGKMRRKQSERKWRILPRRDEWMRRRESLGKDEEKGR